MDSCPKELEPYDAAHKIKLKEQDALMHAWFGNYGLSAFVVAIDHCFNKKAQSEYIKKPILSNVEQKETELPVDEQIKQAENVFLQLQIMGANFNVNKKKDN